MLCAQAYWSCLVEQVKQLCRAVPYPTSCMWARWQQRAGDPAAIRPPPEPAESTLSSRECVVQLCLARRVVVLAGTRITPPPCRPRVAPSRPPATPTPETQAPASNKALQGYTTARTPRSVIRAEVLTSSYSCSRRPSCAGAGAGIMLTKLLGIARRLAPCPIGSCPATHCKHWQAARRSVFLHVGLGFSTTVRALPTPTRIRTHLAAARPGSPLWPCWSQTA